MLRVKRRWVGLKTTWYLVLAERREKFAPVPAVCRQIRSLGLHQLHPDDGEVDRGPEGREVINGLDVVHKGE